ncbi:hypothetical protein [Amycolatopsis rhizosphaerae]|nr:hypothetical protein [Amycolatopsis rhizosphaerae]
MPQYPGGVDLQRKPSGGTAIAAGVLAAAGALFGILFAIRNFSTLDMLAHTKLAWVGWMQAIAYVIEVITLGPGAVLLFMRKTPGRWLVLTGSAVQIAQGIIALAAVWSSGIYSSRLSNAEMMGATAGGLFVVLIPAIATVILAALPITGRWLAWGNQPPSVQQPPAYGQQPPGFGQPPQW